METGSRVRAAGRGQGGSCVAGAELRLGGGGGASGAWLHNRENVVRPLTAPHTKNG